MAAKKSDLVSIVSKDNTQFVKYNKEKQRYYVEKGNDNACFFTKKKALPVLKHIQSNVRLTEFYLVPVTKE